MIVFMVLEFILRMFPFLYTEVNNSYKYLRWPQKPQFGVSFYSFSEIFPLQFDERKYYGKTKGVVNYYFNQFGARWIYPENQETSNKNAIVVGDSFTLGFGLRYEDAYVFKLQEFLARKKIPINFFNLAKPGADSEKCLSVYRQIEATIPHDMVIYGLHLNDLIPFGTSEPINYVSRYNLSVLRENKTVYDWCKRIRENSKLLTFIFQRVTRKGRESKIKDLVSPSRFTEPFFIKNMNAIKQMDLEARQKGAKFFVVILPILVGVQENVFGQVYAHIREALERYDVSYFDLSSSVASYADKDLWILPFDQHPNEVANSCFARRLCELTETNASFN